MQHKKPNELEGINMTEVKGLQTGFANIEGASLYYEIAGEGPGLVLAHAGFVDRRMWDEQFAIFAGRYRVVRYDRRGFGNSTLGSSPFAHRRDLYQLLKLLNIERAHLLGCSAGGGTIIDFALEHPEMTASLVLVSSALGGYQFQGAMPQPLQELITAANAGDLDRAAEIAVRLWIDGPQRGPDQVDARLRERAHEMSITALPNIFVREEPLEPPAIGRLNQLAIPTLVISGELDDASVGTISELLATQIAGARKATISGAAHLPNMEKPEEFNQMVLGFLKAVRFGSLLNKH
jgi:pimeloyl-ACP methyl ester carboxylesterase